MGERSTRTDRDVAALREATEAEIAALRTEIESLKIRRWPLPAVGALTGIAALVVALLQGTG